MGDLVAIASFRERRRSAEARRLHDVCRALLAASVAAERVAAANGPPAERTLHLRRLRAFEDAQAYATTVG
jgi:hypothetical protein